MRVGVLSTGKLVDLSTGKLVVAQCRQHPARMLFSSCALCRLLCFRFGSRPRHKITYFHGCGSFRSHEGDSILCVAMSVEETNQRLEVAEGVIRELQDELQRVSAGHQAAHEALQFIHQEMNLFRCHMETRSRIRLVEPKKFDARPFRGEDWPGWRTWSCLARDFVGVVHTVLKHAMKRAENQK